MHGSFPFFKYKKDGRDMSSDRNFCSVDGVKLHEINPSHGKT